MWFSPSVGATGRLVRPVYRTPFGVSKPTIGGRATAARTGPDLCQHSTIWQYGRAQLSSCLPPCRLPPRPTRVVLPTSRKPSLLEAGGSVLKDADRRRVTWIRSQVRRTARTSLRSSSGLEPPAFLRLSLRDAPFENSVGRGGFEPKPSVLAHVRSLRATGKVTNPP